MHQQSNRQLQERATSLPVQEVLEAAMRFFARQSGVYSAFVEKQGPSHVALRGMGGEEVIIGARVTDAGTVVTGSSYLFDAQIARFLDSLPVAPSQAAVHADDTAAIAAAGSAPSDVPAAGAAK